MAQISLNIPDDLLQHLAQSGENPAEFLQERLRELSLSSASAQKFQVLVERWRQETRHLSLMSDIVLNSAYQQIIWYGSGGDSSNFTGFEAAAGPLVLGVAIDYGGKSDSA